VRLIESTVFEIESDRALYWAVVLIAYACVNRKKILNSPYAMSVVDMAKDV
jgi:hypothetical protein